MHLLPQCLQAMSLLVLYTMIYITSQTQLLSVALWKCCRTMSDASVSILYLVVLWKMKWSLWVPLSEQQFKDCKSHGCDLYICLLFSLRKGQLKNIPCCSIWFMPVLLTNSHFYSLVLLFQIKPTLDIIEARHPLKLCADRQSQLSAKEQALKIPGSYLGKEDITTWETHFKYFLFFLVLLKGK